MWNPTWWIYFKYTLSSKAAGKQQLVTANLIVLDHTLSHLQSHFQSSLAELLKATGSWQLLALVAGEAADRPSGLLVSCIPCPAKNGDHNKMRKQVWIFLQFILHSLGELEKYSLLRITLAHLFLQFYSPSNQVDLARRIQSHSELCLAKIISLTLHASGKHNKIQLMVLLQVCACYNTRIVGLLRTDDWC